MFTVIYEFEVIQGKEDQFRSAWKEMTNLIIKYEGGLGSRLHLDQDGKYIAYAQWPNREKWENMGDQLPKEAEAISARMREACSSRAVSFELEVIEDELIHK